MTAITNLNVSAFADLTGSDTIRIVTDEASVDQRHTLYLGPYDRIHVALYLTPGSLEALRDAITTHLGDS